MPAPSPIMRSKSSWRSASPCAHCKLREHAHERCRTTDLTRRRPAQGGRTVSIDTAAAENAPGVLVVLTHKNMPRMNPVPWSHLHPQGQTYLPLQDDQIHYAGQPIALVVAATLDQATYAGTLIKIAYETHSPTVFDLRTAKEDAVEPPQRMWPLSSLVGDADKAIRDAAVKI